MSITDDIRSYADNAVTQGKQSLAAAQAQFADVTGTANKYANRYTAGAQQNVADLAGKAAEIADKATAAVNEVVANAEKAINADALRTALEPYLAQAREYGTAVSDRVEELLAGLRSDPRISAVLAQADTLGGAVVEQVNERIVTPVRTLTGLGGKPAKKRTSPSPRPRKAAPTKPATAKPATAKATTAKSTATGPARKSTTSTTPRKTTARKATPKKD